MTKLYQPLCESDYKPQKLVGKSCIVTHDEYSDDNILKMRVRKIAKLRITTILIADLLRLPKTTKIIKVDGSKVKSNEYIEIIVRDENLLPVKEGEEIPLVEPRYGGTIKFDWGQKPEPPPNKNLRENEY